MWILWVFKSGIFIGITRGYRRLQLVTGGFLTRPSTDSFFLFILHKNQSWRNLTFLTKRMLFEPFEKKSNFALFINRCSHGFQRLVHYLKRQETLFLHFCLINTKDYKIATFWPKSSTIPVGKNASFRFFKAIFLLSRKACFLTRTSPNTFSRGILHKTKRWKKLHIFDWNHGVFPWKSANFVGYWKRFFIAQKGLFAI